MNSLRFPLIQGFTPLVQPRTQTQICGVWNGFSAVLHRHNHQMYIRRIYLPRLSLAHYPPQSIYAHTLDKASVGFGSDYRFPKCASTR
ncbi:hypothetical protein D915_006635 [Fasciola hepatica]|uniref:Uncharacterized protein n=1 Tax=Fasciola hepatica TaxID=6192 RepID=A0A4E0RMX5_FASHE|nr:hypothetical protein D915_006635 [Fasciola hepatica]